MSEFVEHYFSYSFNTAMEANSTRTATAMQESLDEFCAVVQESISKWSSGKVASIVKKNEEVSEADLEIMKSAVARLNKTIEKASKDDELEKESEEAELDDNENPKGDEEEMKSDKSIDIGQICLIPSEVYTVRFSSFFLLFSLFLSRLCYKHNVCFFVVNSFITFLRKILRLRYFCAIIIKKGVDFMSISYRKLFHLLIDRNIKKGELQEKAGITASIMARLAKDETVKSDTIGKICDALECQPGDIMENVPAASSEK